LLDLHVEIGEHLAVIGAHLQVGFHVRRKHHVDIAVEGGE
jgi:hypothetical protein